MTSKLIPSLRNKFTSHLSSKTINSANVSNVTNFANSENKTNQNSMLMRDYIEKKLYYDDGYYSNTNIDNYLPIGKLEKPLNFNKMMGIRDYAKELNSKYPKSTWLTCSELLRPYFGYSLGNYILTTHKKGLRSNNNNIKIIEIGCGGGAAIDSILEYLKLFSIKSYKDVEYIGLEMNTILADNTRKLLKDNHPELYENGQLTILNKSIYDYNFTNKMNEECFILGLNLIDSMGHDRIKFERSFEPAYRKAVNNYNSYYHGGGIESFKKFFDEFINGNSDMIKEVHVEVSDNNKKQLFKPINDTQIKQMLLCQLLPPDERKLLLGEEFIKHESTRNRKYEDWFVKFLRGIYSFTTSEELTWLPTESIKLFNNINTNFPNHKLILLDFDFLSSKIFNCDYKGKNSPAVYSIVKDSYESITHPSIFDSYSTTKNPVNIYFPLDFQLLQIVYKVVTGKRGSVNKFKYFNDQFSMNEWCETSSGFNPLIDTHENMSFLLTV